MILLCDKDLRPLGHADHVIRWSYEQRHNNIDTATIILPAEDGANGLIDVGASYARLFDGDDDLGYFRFSAIVAEESGPGGTITYDLQHASCTLGDRMLAGWHEIGGTDYPTVEAMDYILAGQDVWVRGACEFHDNYQYNFEDVTRLEALLSLGEVLLDGYRFEFIAKDPPWVVNLRRIDDVPASALVYRRTMTAIRRNVDGRVVTRLYGRGYGEGDNQLTIASVNGGRDWIDADAETIARYDIREGVHVDTRQTDPAALKARMQQILDAGKSPTVSYEAEAIDLHKVTGESWDKVAVGTKVLVLDDELGALTVLVRSRAKRDAAGDPGEISYVLDNSRPDTAEDLNEVFDKLGVHELYSQGATNMYSMQIADNADAEHPLVMRFYVPGNVLRINSCLLYWQLDPFRTYATQAAAGGKSTRTSSSGGGATVSTPETVVTRDVLSSGPQTGAGAENLVTGGMLSTGGGTDITLETGAATGTTGENTAGLTTGVSRNGAGPMTDTGSAGGGDTGSAGGHSHSVGNHNHSISAPGTSTSTGYAAPNTSTVTAHSHAQTAHSHSMSHWHTLDAHTHSVGSHTHSVPDHTHAHDHMHTIVVSVTIPPMSFELSDHTHTVTLPEHTHEITYGVFEGARAQGVSLTVDGEAVPEEAIGDAREIDVAAYLRKNDDGKVVRGTWHEVAFTPTGLTRITADLFFQVFIQSRGAGDY